MPAALKTRNHVHLRLDPKVAVSVTSMGPVFHSQSDLNGRTDATTIDGAELSMRPISREGPILRSSERQSKGGDPLRPTPGLNSESVTDLIQNQNHFNAMTEAIRGTKIGLARQR